MLVGLNVTDDEAYRSYRAGMTPLLEGIGGGFGYDFKISEVLRSETEAPINRLFTIYFPSEDAMQAFFENANYGEIKRRFFEGAVTDTTILAEYRRT